MAVNPVLSAMISAMMPALEVCLDPVCVVDASGQIVFLTTPMGSLLKVRPRELKRGVVFCDAIKLAACVKECQVRKAIGSGKGIRLDETPGTIGGEKMRGMLQVIPLPKGLGALISVRDTTADVLVLAKYHKLTDELDRKELKIAELEVRLESMRGGLRGRKIT